MRCFRPFLPVLFVAFGVTAQAQDFTVFGGVQNPGAITLGPVIEAVAGSTAQLLADAKNFGVFGARLFHSSAPLGVEHTLAYSPNFVDSDATAFIYNTNLNVELPAPVIRPYATVGVGVVYAGGNGPAAFGAKFSVNYGGGLKMSVFGPAGIRIDIRGYSIRGVDDQTLKVLETSLGIYFSF